MTDSLAWVALSADLPRDHEVVFARAKHGQPRKVTFYALPTPRWEGANIVYDFKYFTEWAALDSERKPPLRAKSSP
jgi:hypothetical protein